MILISKRTTDAPRQRLLADRAETLGEEDQGLVGGNASHVCLLTKGVPPTPARAVHVHFDNDVKIHAPYDAMTLAHLLKLGPKAPAAPDVMLISEEPRTARLEPGRRGKNKNSDDT